MDRENLTTRKGFFKRAGLVVAAAFGASAPANAAVSDPKDTAQSGTETAALNRVRPAKGAVPRKI